MKKFILVLILAGGLTVGGSYQVGKIIESELPRVLQRVGELGQMQITITGYERNIFRSSVRSEIVLASISGSREQVSLNHEIWHGPFPFGKIRSGQWQFTPLSALIETRLDKSIPPSGLVGELLELCPELYESNEITRFDFAGNGTSTYSVPGFEKSFGAGDEAFDLSWKGISGTAFIDKSMKRIEGNVVIPAIRVAGQKNGIIFDNIRSDYQIYEEFGGLLLGNVTVDTGAIEIGDARNKTTIQDIQFRNAAKLNDDTVSYSVTIGIETLQTASETYGPAGFELDFINLDAASILEVQKRLQTIQMEVNKLAEEDISKRVFQIYIEALPGLLQKKPEINLNYLNMTGPSGEFYCKGSILLENRMNRPVKDVGSLLSIIEAKGESVVSKPLLQNMLTTMTKSQLAQARDAGQLGDISADQFNGLAAGTAVEQLAQLEARGTLIPKGDNYHTEFTFKNRRALLNGTPIN